MKLPTTNPRHALALLAFGAATFLSGCAIRMITPFAAETDVTRIWPYCASAATCPTGREHQGLDIFTTGDLKPFQAVADGKVQAVELSANEVTGNWQVNVRVRYNGWYRVEYAFEPFSTERAIGEQQLANILVTPGQKVRQGDLIGRLVQAGEAPHVHFHLDKGLLWWESRPCPEPYFTDAARAAIVVIVRRTPGIERMCY